MKTLMLAMMFLVAGCAGDPMTHDNGKAATSADAGATADTSHHGPPAQDTAACVPQCSGKNCGDNGCGGTCGTCDSDETCNGASLCAPKSQAHACPASAPCVSGERCWCGANGSFTCFALTGLCVTTDGKELCENTSSYTSNCAAGVGCVGGDMSVKDAMCGVTCTGGQVINSATGKCEYPSSGSGDINCTVKRTDSNTWTNLFGGGVVDAGKIGLDSWSQLGKPDNNGTVSFTLKAGLTTLSVLPEIVVDTFYGYGADKGADTVEGGWAIKCDGAPQYLFPAGVNTVANCSGNLAIGQGCLWKGGPGKYRMGYRAR